MNKFSSDKVKLKLLMADDSDADREIVRRILEDNQINCQFEYVSNGAELLSYLANSAQSADASQSNWPDVLLLDINMPCMDGKEAIVKIRELDNGYALPIVVLTTSNRTHDINECYALGANAYITKPVTQQDFNAVISGLNEFWFKLAQLPTQ